MKQKLLAFFSGRNGPDSLSKVITTVSLVLMLLCGFFLSNPVGMILYVVSLSGMIYGYYRMFSRKLIQRQRENFVFLEFCRIRKLKWKERKTHRYFRCPKCRAYLRVPKGRGEITVTCRKCGNKFDKRT